jgi:hypothetical protein
MTNECNDSEENENINFIVIKCWLEEDKAKSLSKKACVKYWARIMAKENDFENCKNFLYHLTDSPPNEGEISLSTEVLFNTMIKNIMQENAKHGNNTTHKLSKTGKVTRGPFMRRSPLPFIHCSFSFGSISGSLLLHFWVSEVASTP